MNVDDAIGETKMTPREAIGDNAMLERVSYFLK